MTKTNAHFLTEIMDLLQASPEFDTRFLDVSDHPDVLQGLRRPARIAEAILIEASSTSERAEALFRPHLDWADVVFVEWCRSHAPLFTMVDPRDTRVIMRLHSFEVFTAWPHLVDFSRVDDLLFVSEHLRDLAQAAIPALQEPDAPDLHVLPLSLRLKNFVRPKSTSARFSLGLVGWGSVAKDPLWALDVLEHLRQRDRRYRLLLIGDAFEGGVSEAAREYGDRLADRLTRLEDAGAVSVLGRTEDVPSALTEVGVILSTSVRESFHAALVEGAASGAVPVVRDWPFFAGKANGASTLFPADWVVASPEQAAERILECTADERTWRRHGEHASAHALGTWDWEIVRPAYEEFLSRR